MYFTVSWKIFHASKRRPRSHPIWRVSQSLTMFRKETTFICVSVCGLTLVDNLHYCHVFGGVRNS
jgi:hypothetical protein